jgi:hypothetical protein
MSQRAVPAMIAQPMFPLGDLNVARLTVAVAVVAADVDGLLVALVVPVVVPVLAGELVLVAVLVTVTVCVLLEPQPQMPSAHAIAAPMRFTARKPIRTVGCPAGAVG